MSKERLNLLVDGEAIRRGKRFSELHGTSVSRLVSDFLSKLPLDDEPGEELTPTVRRLLGAASGGASREEYHHYLLEKYGR
jgi:hypothetical protein